MSFGHILGWPVSSVLAFIFIIPIEVPLYLYICVTIGLLHKSSLIGMALIFLSCFYVMDVTSNVDM